MAENYSNPLSNLSYTHKDFLVVFPELLDMVKKLTYKWDPSISNESDPGVILIKLNALLEDKLNYNTDQAILETFPLSVSQDENARKLYYQLGYVMHWYRSATGTVQLTPLETEESILGYKLNKFTMICDENSEYVYTTTNDVTFSEESENSSFSVDVIQGTIQTYDINGSETITIRNLDTNNRLYFDDTNVAENGIFIANITTDGQEKWNEWNKVDNLSLQPINYKCYQFGVSEDGSYCYIEFPEDIDNLIGKGIKIKFIKTGGRDGNIPAGTLSKFFETYSVSKEEVEDNEVVTKTIQLKPDENISVTNVLPIVSGEDPEDIDSAYRNYKRVKGTFETLVSLRDYINCLYVEGYNEKLISNVFITDRTNDIQESYFINENFGGVHQLDPYLGTIGADGNLDTSNELKSYDLKLYATEYSYGVANASFYNLSFQPIQNYQNSPYREQQQIIDIIDPTIESTEYSNLNVRLGINQSIKSIQHDFTDILLDKFLFFKSISQLNVKIIPSITLSDKQINEIKLNIITALYSNFLSHNLTFGEDLQYYDVLQVILNSDERISQCILDTLLPLMYGVVAHLFVNQNTGIGNVIFVDIPLSSSYTQENDWSQVYTMSSNVTGYRYEEAKEKDPNFVNIADSLRTEFLAKCILKGNTPYFVKNDEFDILLYEDSPTIINEVSRLTSRFEPEIDVNVNVNLESSSNISGYTLKENEVITFLSPSLSDVSNYGNYCKIFTNITWNKDTVVEVANQESFDSGEKYVLICYKNSDEDEKYSYVLLRNHALFTATFSVSNPSQNPSYRNKAVLANGAVYINGQDKAPINLGIDINSLITDSDISTGLIQDTNANYNISKFVNRNGYLSVLTGSQSITTKKIKQIQFPDEQSTGAVTLKCYFITNKIEQNNSSKLNEYVLDLVKKDASTLIYSHILKTNEFFLYSLDNSGLNILGAGTEIKYSTDSSSSIISWKVPVIDQNEIVNKGSTALDNSNSWLNLKFSASNTLTIVENNYIALGKDSQLVVFDEESIVIRSYEKHNNSWLYVNLTDSTLNSVTSEGDTIPEDATSFKLRFLENIDGDTFIVNLSSGTEMLYMKSPKVFEFSQATLILADPYNFEADEDFNYTNRFYYSISRNALYTQLNYEGYDNSLLYLEYYNDWHVFEYSSTDPSSADDNIVFESLTEQEQFKPKGTPQEISNSMTIYYTQDGSASYSQYMTWDVLQRYSVSEQTGISWKVFTTLNINMSKESPQLLGRYDYIDYFLSSNTTQNLNGTIPGSYVNDIYIQTSKPLYAEGGEYIDVRVKDEQTGLLTYPTLMYYSTNSMYENLERTTGTISYDGTLSRDEIALQFPFDGYEGYIVPIRVYAATGSELVSFSPSVTDIFGNAATIKDVGLYWIDLKQNCTMTIEANADVVFYPVLPYSGTNNNLVKIEGLNSPSLLEYIEKLDPDKVFDYTYYPSSEGELIEDPTSINGFTNVNHLYHNYFIPLICTSWVSSKDKIEKSLSDNITVINQIRQR